MNSPQVSYVELDNSRDVDVTGGINEDSDWRSFVDNDLSHCHKRNEKDGLAFIPAKFKPENEWTLSAKKNHRHDGNVESLTMIVLDIDDESGLEKTMQMFGEFEHVMYSTFSYSENEAPYKMRMVLPLENAFTVDQWYECFDQLKHCIDIDPSCRNASRLYYYHSMPETLNDRPVFTMNNGGYLDYEKLTKVIKSFIRNLDDEARAEVNTKIAQSNKPQHRTHFSGGQAVNIYQGKNKNLIPDFSYEGFVERHKKLIDQELSARCFDNFSLKATKREIENFGSVLNLDALIQFVTRASIEFTNSNHVLTPNSDTLNSLPTKITGAMSKFQPEWFAQLGGPSLHGKLLDMVNASRVKAASKQWSFPEPINKQAYQAQQPVKAGFRNQAKEKPPEYSEGLLRKRNKDAIMSFAADKSPTAAVSLFANIAKAEYDKFPSSSSINLVAEFIFKQLQRFHVHTNSGVDINPLLDGNKQLLLDNADAISNYIGANTDSYTGSKIATSIKLAHSRATGKLKWSPEFEDQSTKELVS